MTSITPEEWARVKRHARRRHGIGAEGLEELGQLLGRDAVALAFDGELSALMGVIARAEARQKRHEANRAAWLHNRLSDNGRKGAVARWGRRQQQEQT